VSYRKSKKRKEGRPSWMGLGIRIDKYLNRFDVSPSASVRCLLIFDRASMN
jgi:hypothetical protein